MDRRSAYPCQKRGFNHHKTVRLKKLTRDSGAYSRYCGVSEAFFHLASKYNTATLDAMPKMNMANNSLGTWRSQRVLACGISSIKDPKTNKLMAELGRIDLQCSRFERKTRERHVTKDTAAAGMDTFVRSCGVRLHRMSRASCVQARKTMAHVLTCRPPFLSNLTFCRRSCEARTGMMSRKSAQGRS